jgi:hypothetical protein
MSRRRDREDHAQGRVESMLTVGLSVHELYRQQQDREVPIHEQPSS